MEDGRRASATNVRAFLLGGALATIILSVPTVIWSITWPVGLESALGVLLATAIAWWMPRDALMRVPLRGSQRRPGGPS